MVLEDREGKLIYIFPFDLSFHSSRWSSLFIHSPFSTQTSTTIYSIAGRLPTRYGWVVVHVPVIMVLLTTSTFMYIVSLLSQAFPIFWDKASTYFYRVYAMQIVIMINPSLACATFSKIGYVKKLYSCSLRPCLNVRSGLAFSKNDRNKSGQTRLLLLPLCLHYTVHPFLQLSRKSFKQSSYNKHCVYPN